MRKQKKGFFERITPGWVSGAALAALLLCFGLMISDAKAPVDEDTAIATPGPALHVVESGDRVRTGCEITQTMGFSRCGHSATRRITAPEALVGMDFAGVQAYYDVWQLSSYSADRMAMSRKIPLFCPIHRVLTVNEAGEVVLSHNQYGDGMAVLRTYPETLAQFDEETQEELRLGLGFDAEEEADAWLAAH